MAWQGLDFKLPDSGPSIATNFLENLARAQAVQRERENAAFKEMLGLREMGLKQAHADAYAQQVEAQNRAVDAKETRDQRTYEMQQRKELAEAQIRARGLAEQGDLGGAEMLLSPYGFKLDQGAPSAAPPPPATPIVGGGAMPDAMENAARPPMPDQMADPEAAALYAVTDAAPVTPPPVAATPTAGAPTPQAPTPAPQSLPYAPGPAAQGVRAARTAAAPSGPVRFVGANGEPGFSVDPFAKQRMAEAQKQQTLQQLDATFGADPNSLYAKQFKEVRNAYANGWVKPEAAFEKMETIRHNMELERAALERARRPKGGGSGLNWRRQGAAEDDARADVSAFGQEYSRFESHAMVKQATEAHNKAQDAIEFINGGGTIGERAALYQVARGITGPGVLTQQEFDATVKNTGGLLESALSKLRQKADGRISEGEAQALFHFVKVQASAAKRKGLEAVKSFDARFGPKSRHASKVPGEIENQRAELAMRFGISPEELPPSPLAAAPASGDKNADLAQKAQAALKGEKGADAKKATMVRTGGGVFIRLPDGTKGYKFPDGSFEEAK